MTTVDAPAFTGAVHPAAEKFPLINGDEFDALVESIREHGLQEPCWLGVDGTLLDGRNRLRACQEAGVEPSFRVYDGDDVVDFIVRLNIHRRHLTEGQKAMVAYDLLPEYEAEAKARQGARTDLSDIGADRHQCPQPPTRAPRAADHAAKAVGTSGRSVGRAKAVSTKAPDLAEKVRSGELALSAAEKQANRREAERKEQEARQTVMADVPVDASGEGWSLLHGDFRERLESIPDGTVDLILTDPPYPREFLHLWGDLAKHAARVLAPQGVLVGMTGQIMLPEVLELLGRHLHYGWCYCQPLPGANSRIMARHTLQAWKPWVAYSNGPWPSGRIDWHEDMLEPSERTKSVFRWEQDGGPAGYLIEVLSPKGGSVLDPFAGSGAYGVEALRRDRKFIGCEMDADRFSKASERLTAC